MKYTLETKKGRINVAFLVLHSIIKAKCRLVYIGYNPQTGCKVYRLYTK